MQAQLAQSDRLSTMGMLSAGVAHEINNPLSYVLGNLESLTEDLPDVASAARRAMGVAVESVGEEAWKRLMGADAAYFVPAHFADMRDRCRDALDGTLRIKEVVRGLRTFSRVDDDRVEEVELADAMNIACDMAFSEIKYRARIVKDYQGVSPVAASESKLAQVFLNLLINAAHAIPEGEVERHVVRVRIWQESDEVCAQVQDDGKGMSDSELARIFEPFFTTKDVGVGTGLGLSISQNIVESFGGRIEVRSRLGVGTTFVVRLPIGEVDGGLECGAAPEAAFEDLGPCRVLVVDDEGPVRRSIARMLARHEVVQAASGARAREILEADQRFDLVLCDIMMPETSGVALHEWLASVHPGLASKVVFITGGAFTRGTREYLVNVCNVQLTKPFSSAELQRAVGEFVGKLR
jgi:CheY-like chemotaxis protein